MSIAFGPLELAHAPARTANRDSSAYSSRTEPGSFSKLKAR
jgi:hypothetical protein